MPPQVAEPVIPGGALARMSVAQAAHQLLIILIPAWVNHYRGRRERCRGVDTARFVQLHGKLFHYYFWMSLFPLSRFAKGDTLLRASTPKPPHYTA